MTVKVIYEFATDRHVIYCDDHGRIAQSEKKSLAIETAKGHAQANGEEFAGG